MQGSARLNRVSKQVTELVGEWFAWGLRRATCKVLIRLLHGFGRGAQGFKRGYCREFRGSFVTGRAEG